MDGILKGIIGVYLMLTCIACTVTLIKIKDAEETDIYLKEQRESALDLDRKIDFDDDVVDSLKTKKREPR